MQSLLPSSSVPINNKEYLRESNCGLEEEEQQGCKEKFPPYTYNSFLSSLTNNGSNKEEIFWKIYDKLEEEELVKSSNLDSSSATMQIDKNTISGTELKNRLVSSNKFFIGDALSIIEEMVKLRKLEKVSFDTYRRRITTTKDNPIYSKNPTELY